MTGPDEAVRAASDAIETWCAANRERWPDLPESTWPPEFPGVPRFTAPTEPVTVTYTTAPRIGGEPLSTQDAREMMAKLLAKFEAEADHTDDEKRAYAVALRVTLGLPAHEDERTDEDD
jgi:hypothetical protein